MGQQQRGNTQGGGLATQRRRLLGPAAPGRRSSLPAPITSPTHSARPPSPRPARSEALRLFNAILHIVPLLVVESRKEADEVRELVTIAR